MIKINNFLNLLKTRVQSDPELNAALIAANNELQGLNPLQKLQAFQLLKKLLSSMGFNL